MLIFQVSIYYFNDCIVNKMYVQVFVNMLTVIEQRLSVLEDNRVD